MTAETHLNGHKIYSYLNTRDWFYKDDDSPIKDGDGNFVYRPCPACGNKPTAEGHDACLANLPGVKNACCGHGVELGYIQFEDGTVIRFDLRTIDRDGKVVEFKCKH